MRYIYIVLSIYLFSLLLVRFEILERSILSLSEMDINCRFNRNQIKDWNICVNILRSYDIFLAKYPLS